jgi:hypothetical protein
VVIRKRCAILEKITLLEKGIKIHTLSDSCGHKRNKTMTNMWSGWRTRRILLRKKTRLLKQGLFLCF